MAKGKGKSRRRIRNWQERYTSPEQSEDAASTRGGFTSRAVKLPARRLEAPDVNLEELPKARAMVVGLFPGGAMARLGGRDLLCGIAKTFRAPEGSSALVVGDDVTVALSRSDAAAGAAAADGDRADGMILSRQDRRSVLARPQPRSAKRRGRYGAKIPVKVIAANMDALLIVASTRQPTLHHGLIDRFLIVAERGELTPLLVINKIDLAAPDETLLKDFRALDIRICPCSALTGAGLDGLRASLAGRRSVLAGASGTGKSTLINAIVPGASAATRPVRLRDERGRHVTAAATVYELPAGGLIVDTPGVRELGVQLEAPELGWYFPEFEDLAGKCRFNNCTHTHEPACAVRAAAEAGEIPPRRYQSYLRILQTLLEKQA